MTHTHIRTIHELSIAIIRKLVLLANRCVNPKVDFLMTASVYYHGAHYCLIIIVYMYCKKGITNCSLWWLFITYGTNAITKSGRHVSCGSIKFLV